MPALLTSLQAFQRLDAAWHELGSRMSATGCGPQLRRDIATQIHQWLHPFGDVDIESLGKALHDAPSRMTLGKALSDADQQLSNAARVVIDALTQRKMFAELSRDLTAGRLDAADPHGMRDASRVAFEDAQREILKLKIGRDSGLGRRKHRMLAPARNGIVWPIYQAIAPVMLAAQRAKPQFFHREWLNLTADFVTGSWGPVVGDLNGRDVQPSVQELLGQCRVEAELRNLWSSLR